MLSQTASNVFAAGVCKSESCGSSMLAGESAVEDTGERNGVGGDVGDVIESCVIWDEGTANDAIH